MERTKDREDRRRRMAQRGGSVEGQPAGGGARRGPLALCDAGAQLPEGGGNYGRVESAGELFAQNQHMAVAVIRKGRMLMDLAPECLTWLEGPGQGEVPEVVREMRTMTS